MESPQKHPPRLYVGIAGWNIATPLAAHFGEGASHLERYATRFDCVEINSSFYRHHLAKSYRRWADAVPESFRFAVKLARTFTHERRLRLDAEGAAELRRVLIDVRELGDRLGPLLVQLPPSLGFPPADAREFFVRLRELIPGAIVFEPRHPAWRTDEARRLLAEANVSVVWADPSPIYAWPEYRADLAATPPAPAEPAILRGVDDSPLRPRVLYSRLHGTPVIYRSEYGEARVGDFAESLAEAAFGATHAAAELWCIFDNTALGHAIPDAIRMQARFARAPDLLPEPMTWPPAALRVVRGGRRRAEPAARA